MMKLKLAMAVACYHPFRLLDSGQFERTRWRTVRFRRYIRDGLLIGKGCRQCGNRHKRDPRFFIVTMISRPRLSFLITGFVT